VRLVPLLIYAAGLLSGSACGSVPTPAAPASGSTVAVGQAEAGQTVQVKVGDTVRVTLQDGFPVPGAALVWNVTSANETVLAPAAISRSTPVPSGPGRYDTYTADFHANAAGQAVLDAHGATSCEAMPKQNCPDRDFRITVVVRS
jgi:FtsP/CotA-like multicopper oxidase with cupredoxin domain